MSANDIHTLIERMKQFIHNTGSTLVRFNDPQCRILMRFIYYRDSVSIITPSDLCFISLDSTCPHSYVTLANFEPREFDAIPLIRKVLIVTEVNTLLQVIDADVCSIITGCSELIGLFDEYRALKLEICRILGKFY